MIPTWLLPSSFRPLYLAAVFAGLPLSRPLPAQEPPAKAAPTADAPSLQIVIPDEPRALGSEGILPPELTRPVTIEFAARPFAEVVQWLREEQKLKIELAGTAKTMPAQETVTDRLEQEPLELLLDRLAVLDVGWYLEKGTLYLTGLGEANQHQFVTAYNLGPLLDAGFDAERLLDTLRQGTGGPWSKDEAGGGTTIIVGDVLFVRQRRRTQTEVAALLAALQKHGRRTLLLDPPQHAALRDALTRRISVNFDEVPLGQAIRKISETLQVEFRIDPLLARNVAFDREPITFVAVDQDLESILSRLSPRTPVAAEIKFGSLWITLKAAQATPRLTAVYDVRDLCLDDEEAAALREAIQKQTGGAQGSSNASVSPKPGILVIRQTLEQHDMVSTLLEDYRGALRASKLRVKADEDQKKLELRMYRVPTVMADEAEALLLELVAPQSWKSVDATQPGTIKKATSQPRVLDAGGPGEIGKSVLPYSVLLIRQMVENHRAIAVLLHRLESGDPPPPSITAPARKSGIGGFGRGYFPAKP